MARGDVILRQWNLLKTLQTRGEGVPLRQLAKQFGVTNRTIQRDFEVLEELGFPLEHDEDEYGKRFWRLPYDFFKTAPLMLGLTEAVSLHLADRLFAPLAGTHFAEGLDSILDKIRSHVPAKALNYFADLDQTICIRQVGLTDYSSRGETVRTLVDAAREKQSVEITYRSLWRGEQYTTLFDPYGMVYSNGDLFIVGRSHRAVAIRVFKVSRITDATATVSAFKRPSRFKLEEQFRNSFGIIQTDKEPVEVVAKFEGAVAGLVEERLWHESQRLQWVAADDTLFEEAPDEPEALIATFKLANMVEFKQWIKGFGDQAEVLEPAWLRQEMKQELQAAAARYED